jgi:hypothetical protein
MKNIKFIPIILIALTLIISSCAVDNDPALIPMGESATASLDKTGDIFVQEGSEISLDFVLSRTLARSTQFTYTLNGVDRTIDLIQGQQSVSLSIPNVVGETNTIVLTGAYGLGGGSILVGTTNNSVTFISVPAVNPNALEILMLWGGDENDLDLWITDDPPSTAFATSETTTPSESVSFGNTNPDGSYNILPRVWSAVDTRVDVKIFVIHPDGTIEIFEDSVSGETPQAWYYFVKFDKVTDVTTGNVSYKTTKVPAVSVF